MDLLKYISNIQTNWKEVLIEISENKKSKYDKLSESLKNQYETCNELEIPIYPPKHLIFNAFNYFNINDLKVVIIGQDCYHGPEQAMGLSFSVPKHVKIPPSLRNIYKEINQDEELVFSIPNHGDLENWAKQGILLLNCALTVREKSPLSHMKYWKNYTDYIIRYISDNCTDVIFLLWGTFSKSKKKLINLEKHHILESHHPSPLSANRGGWFGCKHFSKTNKILNLLGKTEIDWNL